MALPQINAARLQRVVTDLESGRKFNSLEELSYKVAGTNWAQQTGLDAVTVRELMKHHGTVYKTGQEVAVAPTEAPPLPEAPPPAVPAPMPAPKPPIAPPPRKPIAPPATPPDPAPSPKKEGVTVATKAEVDVAPPPPIVSQVEVIPVPVSVPAPAPPSPTVNEEKDEDDDDEGGSSDDVKTYEEGGRGRKQCPKCRKFVGARVQVCACSHEFEEGSKKGGTPHSTLPPEFLIRDAKASAASQRYGCTTFVIAPAGKPPVQLKGTSRDEVEEWAEDIRAHRRAKDSHFISLGALLYWVMTLALEPEEKGMVCKHLRAIYPEE